MRSESRHTTVQSDPETAEQQVALLAEPPRSDVCDIPEKPPESAGFARFLAECRARGGRGAEGYCPAKPRV